MFWHSEEVWCLLWTYKKLKPVLHKTMKEQQLLTIITVQNETKEGEAGVLNIHIINHRWATNRSKIVWCLSHRSNFKRWFRKSHNTIGENDCETQGGDSWRGTYSQVCFARWILLAITLSKKICRACNLLTSAIRNRICFAYANKIILFTGDGNVSWGYHAKMIENETLESTKKISWSCGMCNISIISGLKKEYALIYEMRIFVSIFIK